MQHVFFLGGVKKGDSGLNWLITAHLAAAAALSAAKLLLMS